MYILEYYKIMVLDVTGKGYWKALSPELSSQSSPSLMRFQTRCAPSPCTARRTPAAALTHTMAELLMLTMLMSIFQRGTVCGNLNQPAV